MYLFLLHNMNNLFAYYIENVKFISSYASNINFLSFNLSYLKKKVIVQSILLNYHFQ